MKVKEYINKVEPDEVIEIHNKLYNHCPLNKNIWLKFRNTVNDCIELTTNMTIVISHVKKEDGEYFDVSGRDENNVIWSMSFVPWTEWKGMEVIDETNCSLTQTEIAAHIIWEMTWDGWPEEIQAKKDELFDMVTKINRDLEAD